MPQNVLVSVLGEGEYLPHLVRAILEKEIIPARNLFLSSKNQVACQAAEGYDVRICEDDISAVIKSEIVLVTASKHSMPCIIASTPHTLRTRREAWYFSTSCRISSSCSAQ